MRTFILSLKTINKRDYFLLYALLNIAGLYLLYGITLEPAAFVGDHPKTIRFYNIFTTVMYVISPLYEFVKIYIIAKIIQKGINRNLKIESDFKIVFLIVLTAQFSMVLADIVKSLWIMLVQTNMQDEKNFFPLSLYSFLGGGDSFHYRWKPLLRIINAFEILYWFILSIGISTIFKTSDKKGFMIVLRTYGVLLFVVLALKFLFDLIISGLY